MSARWTEKIDPVPFLTSESNEQPTPIDLILVPQSTATGGSNLLTVANVDSFECVTSISEGVYEGRCYINFIKK